MLIVYQDYYALVCSTVYNEMRCENDIDDLVEDTFINLIEKNPLFYPFDCCTSPALLSYLKFKEIMNQEHSCNG